MKTWEKNIRRVEPYVPGEQPKVKDVVKLNTNENPYPPTPKVHEAAERMNISDLRLYPDPEVTDLVHAIAAYYGINKKTLTNTIAFMHHLLPMEQRRTAV